MNPLIKTCTLFGMLLLLNACGDGPYKCVYEKKIRDGSWEERCQTFWADEVHDVDTFCDKYWGQKTHSIRPSDTVYSTRVAYRNSRREEGTCEEGE